jgi:VWFA-related protein
MILWNPPYMRWLKALPLLLLLCLIAPPFYSQAQAPAQAQKPNSESTIRVGVGLVQTDIMVFDAKGRFVDNLKQNQFQLLVDGKPQPIDFFELVTEGGPAGENAPGAAAPSIPAPRRAAPNRAESGRTLLFFLDDLHMSADSMVRSRAALLSLIDKSMGVNDRGAIFTTSRQLGFLQQLSDNKAVLRLALARLTFFNDAIRDLSRPAMNEAQAAAIELGDPDIIGYFIDQTVSAYGLVNDSQGRSTAAEITRSRAASLAHVSAEFAVKSLISLGNIVQSCAALPGRKLLFFLSDGFVLQQQKADIIYRLRLVAEAAARAAIVIYTLDARGLVVGLSDATSPPAFAAPQPPRADPSASAGELPPATSPAEPAGRLERGFSEVLATQDGLNALASDTGGRFLKNTNALDGAIVQSMEEASRYYLLGWHVDPERLQAGKYSSIRVTLPDRPDLKLRLRQGSMDLSKLIPKVQPQKGKPAPSAATPDSELIKALQYPWPIEDLPAFLHAGYLYHPQKGYVLDISVQVEVENDEPGAGTGKEEARIDIMGIVANRDGANVDRFKGAIYPSVDAPSPAQAGSKEFAYTRLVGIDPGVYQVRVAARDPKSGRIGSAHLWVDIPRIDLLASPTRKIQLSSIFLKGQQLRGSAANEVTSASFDEKQFSAKRRYTASRLPFLVQIYNAASSSITLQTRVYRGNQVVIQSDARPVIADAAMAEEPLFVNGDLSLEGLAPGSYMLEIIAAESSAHAIAKQLVPFRIAAK